MDTSALWLDDLEEEGQGSRLDLPGGEEGVGVLRGLPGAGEPSPSPVLRGPPERTLGALITLFLLPAATLGTKARAD